RILQSIIENQGYTFVEYNGIADSKEVQTLIELLGIEQNILSSQCFIYQDNHHRLVFIHEDLSEEERMIVLAHEEGHIWNKHMCGNSSSYENILQEHEANEFAHYILKTGKTKKWIRRVIPAMMVLALGVMTVVFTRERQQAVVYTDSLFVTDAGEKYHRKECVYVRDRKDVHKLTQKEYESELYEACEVCFPDDQGGEAG
ncbi:MAG: ImmA/IrrE family metallo-endopeptidase, partial [Lachnospiraceae bacterium]|nr:ImmA/IrrE family metallo-endopeptidase [Lachnospiraceae bacterium]